jgi:hypothetical protein
MAGTMAAAVAALSLSACAPVHVNASLERGMDFAKYTSYTWASEHRFNTGDPRLDNNEIFEGRLRQAVDRGLEARGLEQASASSAELVVHYHASVSQQIDVNTLDRQYGYCNDCRSSVYDAGTITIDFVDAKTNKLVWRGWAEGSLEGIDNQEVIEARVDEAVAKILQKLPPRL